MTARVPAYDGDIMTARPGGLSLERYHNALKRQKRKIMGRIKEGFVLAPAYPPYINPSKRIMRLKPADVPDMNFNIKLKK